MAELKTFIHDVETDLGEIAKALETIAAELGTCYAEGTLIRTMRGDVAVEALTLDDIAVTASGEHRPIRWIGHRAVDCTRHPDRKLVLPVRITANAFGLGKPERDLFISPGHAICVTVLDEVLVPASTLINGATVAQIETDEVTYWHVELDSHDILLANGLPAESFIDVGNRSFFVESSTVAIDVLPDARAKTLSDYCRPFVDGGVLVQALRERLRHHALGLNWTIGGSRHGDVHLVADGTKIEPDMSGLNARFVVPATAKDVWLVSETSIPDYVGINVDRRTLGVCIGAITIDDGLEMRAKIDLDHPQLSEGFHPLEPGSYRWTSGRAHLPAVLWEGCRGMFFLRVDLASEAAPRWIAPDAVTSAAVIEGASEAA